MKTILERLLLLLVLLVGFAPTIKADNHEFDEEYGDNNFQCYNAGQYALHFKLLAWAEGGYNHWAGDDDGVSHVDLVIDGQTYTIMQYRTENDWNTDTGKDGHVQFMSKGIGTFTITNCSDGTSRKVGEDETDWKNYYVKHSNTSRKNVYIEFDWFPPNDDKFSGKKADVHIIVRDCRRLLSNETRRFDRGPFTLADAVAAPTLYDASFYPNSSTDEQALAQAIIPYSSTTKVVSYHTSLEPDKEIKVSDMAGLLYVDLADTVSRNFYVEMVLQRDENTNVTIKSNRVEVPAYHKIYDFHVSPFKGDDGTEAYKGYKKLTWTVKMPKEYDAVNTDIYTIQRAYNSDFSDAVMVDNVSYTDLSGDGQDVEDVKTYEYSYVDSTEEATYNSINPEWPIYYRIRRSSAYNYGWSNKNYAAVDSSMDVLTQPFLTLSYFKKENTSPTFRVNVKEDKNFDKNRQVHFTVPIGCWYIRSYQWWDERTHLELVRRVEEDPSIEVVKRIPSDSLSIWDVSDNKGEYFNVLYKAQFTDAPEIPCYHYHYYLRMDTTQTRYAKLDEESDVGTYGEVEILIPDDYDHFYFDDAPTIATFEASQGTNARTVNLAWTLEGGGADYFNLQRRAAGTEDEWETVKEKLTDQFYLDSLAVPGKLYEYQLTSVVDCSSLKESTKTTTGYRSAYGKITGKVQFTNGTAVANVTVVAKRQETAGTYYTDYNGKETKHTDSFEAITAEDGTFVIDSVAYTTNGSTFSISVSSQNTKYTCNGSNMVERVVNTEQPINSDILFESSDFVRMTGRVLFEGTTIPVHNAYFLLNGQIVKNVSGSLIMTDASGNFEVSVPKDVEFTFQAVMPGHTFHNDGFVIVDGSKNLHFSKAPSAVRIWDKTRVKMIGHVVGGTVQGNKPLGFGESKNNLGDDLQFVLQLEGDNISQLVYDENDKTLAQRDTIYPHAVEGQQTEMLTSKSRITVRPDATTGEYVVELFPVKYKVTQATAKGYGSLFNSELGTQTIDLTNKLKSDTLRSNNLKQPYNYTYNIIYRSSPTLTAEQYVNGLPANYLGEKEMTYMDLASTTTQKVPLVEKNDNGSYSYVFGHPVFASGYRYMLRLSGHENYYYNNDETTVPDQVMLTGNAVRIDNGLASASTTQDVNLGSDGTVTIMVDASNPYFAVAGDSALRCLDMAVLVDGEYIKADPIKAFVTGSHTTGNDVRQKLGSDIVVNDVLRDPPGSGSYAYIKKGSSYSTQWNIVTDFKYGFNLTLKFGKNYQNIVGLLLGGSTFNGWSIQGSQSDVKTIPIVKEDRTETDLTYAFTTEDEIRTGSAPSEVGSMADVYIGSEAAVYASTKESFCLVDSATHARLQPAIAAGTATEVASGIDSNGKTYYMMIAKELTYTGGLDSKFVYTQKHILKQIIPEICAQRNSLLRQGTEKELQDLADQSGEVVFQSLVDEDDEKYGLEGGYKMLIPAEMNHLNAVDEVAEYNKLAAQWFNAIAANEKVKLNGCPDACLMETYSLSAGSTISHDESTTYTRGYQTKYNKSTWEGIGKGAGTSLAAAAIEKLGETVFNAKCSKFTVNLFKDFNKYLSTYRGQAAADGKTVSTYAPGLEFDFELEPVLDFSEEVTNYQTITQSKNSGFVLEDGSNGYLNVSVYRITDNEWNDSESHTNWRELANDVEPSDSRNTAHLYADYVYHLNGGATRCPYEGGDSTLFYLPGQPIGDPTLKIDKPMMDANVYTVSDVPEDESAIFNVRLWNDSETNTGEEFVTGEYQLFLDPYSNTKGAVVTMDGVNLEMGTSLWLDRGTILDKVIEVKRGTDYDYDDIVLCMAPACDMEYGNYSNLAQLTLSAHFMPSSSDVAITSPTNGWVLNTDSPHDSTGYYLPITIEGFDYNYRNFDHIEFQYKLSTQSDESWVNLCSYYYDEALYDAATGNKDYITCGRIITSFHGERDPMEQQYDLRAVTFCRLGNGYVTKSSAVLTGMKDTRCPRVFGYPTPTDGILGIGEVLSIPFSEDIAGNYLDEDANFEVMGYTNSTSLSDNTSVLFDGTTGCVAQSESTRSLTKKDLTIDMLINPNAKGQQMTFFSHGAGKKKMEFGQTADNRLYFNCCGDVATSKQFKDMVAFTRVTATYNNATGEVHFYVGSEDLSDTPNKVVANYICASKITLGAALDGTTPYVGRMMDARVWTREFTQPEVATYQDKHLTGYERNLLVYYPMTEGKGTVLTDKANGANAKMTGLTWNRPEGRSLYFSKDNKEGVRLNNEVFSRNAYEDYTLLLWFKTDNSVAADTMALFATGRGTADEMNASSKFFLGLEKGKLALRSKGVLYSSQTVANDDAWHQAAVTVDRGHNVGSLYLDDNLVSTFAVDQLGSFSSDDIRLGASAWAVGDENATQKQVGYPFHGYIDDVTLWESALPQDYISLMDNAAPSGSELGLLAYLSFQTRKLNDNSVPETVYNPYNNKVYYDSDHKATNKQVRLVLDNDAVVSKMLSTVSAPINENGELTKLNFSWMFRENELQISLDMPDAEINKNNLFVTVRDVKDLRGNLLKNPVSWTVYVDRNQLKWDQKQVELQKFKDNEAKYDVKFTNICGTTAQYTIDNLPDWLTATPSSGSISPTDEQNVSFIVSKTLSPGSYSQIIYLTDENGLSEPLLFNVTVQAEKPAWEVDSSLGNTMNVTARVNIVETDGTTSYFDTDENDMVGAFINSTCVGLQNISYTNGESAVYMTLHGNEDMEGENVTFRLWQSEKGVINSLKAEPAVTFKAQGIVGSPSKPVELSTTGNVSMNIDLKKGWNWLSFNIEPTDDEQTLCNSFSTSYTFTNHDYVKTQGAYAEYMDGEWLGTLTQLKHENIYMFHLASSGTIEVVGDPLTTAQKVIQLNKGWNYLPNYLQSNTALTSAMQNYYDYATPGDIIKGYDEYAIFSEEGKWKGSLSYLRPGHGYMLYSQTALRAGVTFTYPETTVAGVKGESAAAEGIFGEYSTNMPIVATVEGQQAEEGSVLEAYDATGQLVGRANRQDDGRYYLLTSASQGTMMSYRLSDEAGVEQARTAPITQYDGTSSIGTVEEPLVLTFGGEQGVSVSPSPFTSQLTYTAVCQPGDDVSLRLFSSTGTLCWSSDAKAADNYFTAKADGLAGLSKGVYMATIKVAGHTYNFKLIKK